MKKTEETKPAFSCEFCNRNFIREKTLVTHICETKHRWLEKDKQSNRMGFQSFLQFYKKHSASKKVKTYEEFIKSAYYIAFVKFGTYCVGSNVLNVPRYVDWLLANSIKLDNWATDTNYTKYLIDYLRKEDAFDAIHRSVESTIDWAEKDNILPKDYLRYGNMNRVCQLICNGKISPWLLYCSESGVRFLETLNPDHVKIINDYINPEQWALKFHREPELKKQITDTLKQAGY
jgi:hypothetical protein